MIKSTSFGIKFKMPYFNIITICVIFFNFLYAGVLPNCPYFLFYNTSSLYVGLKHCTLILCPSNGRFLR